MQRDLFAPGPCTGCLTVAVPVAGGRFVAAGRALIGIPAQPRAKVPRPTGVRAWWRRRRGR